MNFISWGRPRIGSFCTAIRTRFRIQKFRIPFSLYQKFLVSQKVILARPKDTFSLRGGFDNAWLIYWILVSNIRSKFSVCVLKRHV